MHFYTSANITRSGQNARAADVYFRRRVQYGDWYTTQYMTPVKAFVIKYIALLQPYAYVRR